MANFSAKLGVLPGIPKQSVGTYVAQASLGAMQPQQRVWHPKTAQRSLSDLRRWSIIYFIFYHCKLFIAGLTRNPQGCLKFRTNIFLTKRFINPSRIAKYLKRYTTNTRQLHQNIFNIKFLLIITLETSCIYTQGQHFSSVYIC